MLGSGIVIATLDPTSLIIIAVACAILWIIQPKLLLIPIGLIAWQVLMGVFVI